MDQWNTVIKINPYRYGQMVFDKDAKTIQWREDSLLNCARKTRYSHFKN